MKICCCAEIENGIYDSCKPNRKKLNEKIPEKPDFKNCNSGNFKAMAKMNLNTHDILRRNNVPLEMSSKYLNDWMY